MISIRKLGTKKPLVPHLHARITFGRTTQNTALHIFVLQGTRPDPNASTMLKLDGLDLSPETVINAFGEIDRKQILRVTSATINQMLVSGATDGAAMFADAILSQFGKLTITRKGRGDYYVTLTVCGKELFSIQTLPNQLCFCFNEEPLKE